jgi:uncharacterized protein (TIGR02145 family)
MSTSSPLTPFSPRRRGNEDGAFHKQIKIMKTLVAIAILCLCVVQIIQGQSDSVIIRKFYHTCVSPGQKGKNIYGSLFEVKDSSILIANTKKKDVLLKGNFVVSEIFSDKIQQIALYKTGYKGIGKTVGAITGLGAGLIIDGVLIAKNNPGNANTGNNDLDDFFGFIGITGLILVPIATTVTGLLIGRLIDGGFKKQISVRNDQYLFERSKARLSGYSLKYLGNGNIRPLGQFKRIPGTVEDYDGNVYHLLAMGGQVWLAENLITKRYRNGDSIPVVSGRWEWANISAGATCDNRNDPFLTVKFGRLYNRYAVEDSRKICPEGFHVPTYQDWASLILCMGGEENAADGLRGYGADIVFVALGGSRDNHGDFTGTGESGQYWWSVESDTEIMSGFYIKKKSSKVHYIRKDAGENMGMSVRCIRDH